MAVVFDHGEVAATRYVLRPDRFLYFLVVGASRVEHMLGRMLRIGSYVLTAVALGVGFKDERVLIHTLGRDVNTSLGLLISLSLMVLLVTFRMGTAWLESGSAELRIGRVSWDAESKSYFVRINNHGVVTSGKVKIFVSDVNHSNGETADDIVVPIELEGKHVEGVEPMVPYTVKLGSAGIQDRLWPEFIIMGSTACGGLGIKIVLHGRAWAGNESRAYFRLLVVYGNRHVAQWYEAISQPSSEMFCGVRPIKKPPAKTKIEPSDTISPIVYGRSPSGGDSNV